MQRFENLSVKAGFILLALLAFAIGNFWLLISDRSDREIRLATELGALGRIDEALTMSALMAAASDDSYERRYRKLLKERDAVIARMRTLANTEEMRVMIKAVDKAQRAMIAVELRSFTFNAKGQRDAAYGLLNELGYRRDLSKYDTALAKVGAKVREDSARATSQAKWWLVAAGGLLLMLGAAMLVREFRVRAQLAQKAILEAGRRAHRTVMQTVMDAHNNFLNNMVYFRVKAEMSDDFDEEDLRLIDKALDEARDKLQVIAEMEEAAARGDDLRTLGGGIQVLREAADRFEAERETNPKSDETPAPSEAASDPTNAAAASAGPDAPSAETAPDATAAPAETATPSTTAAEDEDAPSAPPGPAAQPQPDAKAAALRGSDPSEEEGGLTLPPMPKKPPSAEAKPRTPTPVLSVRGGRKGGRADASQPS